MVKQVPVFFNEVQLEFKPRYEWAFGEKLAHPETTARAEAILSSLRRAPDDFDMRDPAELPLSSIRSVHDDRLIALYHTARNLPEGLTYYPSVFPKGQDGDPTNLQHAGCFCFDSGTPLNSSTWTAALWSASSAHAAARAVRGGLSLSYSLSRPPGHHASRDLFGGYCYFNNAAIAARTLRRMGRVAVVDIDYHHGNGTQAIFYRDPNVLMISVHADPQNAYPFFCGHASETGAGRGKGFNLNVPLQSGIDGQAYFATLDAHVMPRLRSYEPAALVLSAGFDTYYKDPVGEFTLTTDDFYEVGARFGRLELPTVIVQEGGYYTNHLGRNVQALLCGVRDGQARRERQVPRASSTRRASPPQVHRLVQERERLAKSPWRRRAAAFNEFLKSQRTAEAAPGDEGSDEATEPPGAQE